MSKEHVKLIGISPDAYCIDWVSSLDQRPPANLKSIDFFQKLVKGKFYSIMLVDMVGIITKGE